MIPKKLDEITVEDIRSLIDNDVAESGTLEYKSIPPGSGNEPRDRFLAEVSSLANASGGDLIIGVETSSEGERKGLPKDIKPITNVSADELKLRLENMIRDCIEPRIRLDIREIPVNSGFILILRVPPSFEAPHMIKGSYRFYSRNSAGKYPLDVIEIRRAFLASDSYQEQIRRWRNDRLSRIVAQETPVDLAKSDVLVIHLVSIPFMLNAHSIDIAANRKLIHNKFHPPRSSSYANRFNLDGILTHSSDRVKCYSYCQLFRTGQVEGVCSGIKFKQENRDQECLGARMVEETTVLAIRNYVAGYRELGLPGPALLFLSLLDIKGCLLVVGPELWGGESTADRPNIHLPEIIIDDLNCDIPAKLRPAFDTLWNAFGYERSLNYDEDGNWKLK
ncbi:ATP-binding protein [bacterium]|nr:ATP-binding protein [bacterium]